MHRWEGLDALVAVAETGNFTRAASRLGISTSQVSREINRLEERLGTQLVSRNTRRVALTESGRLFEQRCRQLIDDRDAAFDAIAPGKGEIKGNISLTCSAAYGQQTITPLIRQFLVDHPGISVRLELTDRVLDLIADGIDLGVRTGEVADTRLSRIQISSRSLHLCAAPSYIERYGVPVTASEISSHACLVGTAQNWHFKNETREIQIVPQGRFRCNNGFAILGAALQGLGICQLPDFYVQKHLNEGTLIELLTHERPSNEAIWVVFQKKPQTHPRITTLIEHLKAKIT